MDRFPISIIESLILITECEIFNAYFNRLNFRKVKNYVHAKFLKSLIREIKSTQNFLKYSWAWKSLKKKITIFNLEMHFSSFLDLIPKFFDTFAKKNNKFSIAKLQIPLHRQS